ncbi:MAG: hypothetical protein Q7T86_19435 [Hyphomicrobiaceae bacterium]|nr:hypothetical protein [Hyphomicrobiaceae bacterium]
MAFSALIQHRIKLFQEFRAGLLGLKKDDLTYQVLSEYRNGPGLKMLAGMAAGTNNQIGQFLESLRGIDDVDVLDSARDELVKIVDDCIVGMTGQGEVRSVFGDLILKVKDAKLSTLLREFNAAKDGQPNIAVIGLRTILCLIIRERAKVVDAANPLAIRQDLALQPMLDDAIGSKIFPEGESKLLDAFRRRGLKESSDNVVHKPGDNMLVSKDDLSAAVDLLNKLLPTLT